MKLAELKQKLDRYREDQLKLIIAEMYKMMPKKMIEEKQVDELLSNPHTFQEQKKKSKSVAAEIDFAGLCSETERFIENAYAQNYFAPNKIIHKKDRPQWRFIAKRLADQLTASAQTEEHLPEAARLLEKLYRMLGYASGYCLFSSTEPFSSVRIPQEDFLRKVLMLKTRFLQHNDWIRDALRLLVEVDADAVTLYEGLMEVILEFLTTPALKELAIEECRLLAQKLAQPDDRARNRKYADSLEPYTRKRNIENLHTMAFICRMRLREYDTAIQYFKEFYRNSSKEVELYVLLRHLFRNELKDYWVKEYDEAVSAGVVPRKQLQTAYEYIKQSGQFPKYY